MSLLSPYARIALPVSAALTIGLTEIMHGSGVREDVLRTNLQPRFIGHTLAEIPATIWMPARHDPHNGVNLEYKACQGLKRVTAA